MATRYFKCVTYVTIDDECDVGTPQPTVGDVMSYLADTVSLDVDTEECGNSVGLQSVVMNYETMREITAEEMRNAAINSDAAWK